MNESLEQEIKKLRSYFWSDRDPDGRGFVPLADAYRRAGDLRQAKDLLLDGLKRHPTYASAHVVAAWVSRELSDAEAAVASMNQVLSLDPENLEALRTIAEIAEDQGDHETALDHFRKAAALDTDDPELARRVSTLGGVSIEPEEPTWAPLAADGGDNPPDGAIPAEAFDETPPAGLELTPNGGKDGTDVHVALEDLALEDLASEDLALEDLALEDLASEDLALEDLASEDLALEDLASEDLALEDLASEDLASEDLALEDLASEDLALEDLALEDLALEDLASEDLALEGLALEDLTQEDLASGDLVSADSEGLPLEDLAAADVAREDVALDEGLWVAGDAGAWGADMDSGLASVDLTAWADDEDEESAEAEVYGDDPDTDTTPASDEAELYTRTMGELYARQGLYGRAVTVYEHLLEADPENRSFRERLEELRDLVGDEPVPSGDRDSLLADEDVPRATDLLADDFTAPPEGSDVRTPFAWSETDDDEPPPGEADRATSEYFDELIAPDDEDEAAVADDVAAIWDIPEDELAPPQQAASIESPAPDGVLAASTESLVPDPDVGPAVSIDTLAPDSAPAVSITSPALDNGSGVPIESLAPDATTAVHIDSLAPQAVTAVSIDALAPDPATIVPIESLGPAGASKSISPSSRPVETEVADDFAEWLNQLKP